MVPSCFFCQNLLSDFLEDFLPADRRKELEEHTQNCPTCKAVSHDIGEVIEILKELPSRPVSHELALQMNQVGYVQSLRPWTSKTFLSRAALFGLIPLLLFGTSVALFPTLFPWVSRLGSSAREDHFVRYFPLLQGAGDIVEEHASWLSARGPAFRSFWEEGGLSPDEFERSFSGKGGKTEEPSRELSGEEDLGEP